MKIPILSINGSDSTGQSGIGADIQTIAALGGYAVTAITCAGDYALPSNVVVEQTASVIESVHPKAIKVGLVTDGETVQRLRDEVIACRRLVVAPGIFDAEGKQMIGDDVVKAIARHLVPEALLLMLRCRDAEKMLGISIKTDDDMLEAARLVGFSINDLRVDEVVGIANGSGNVVAHAEPRGDGSRESCCHAMPLPAINVVGGEKRRPYPSSP